MTRNTLVVAALLLTTLVGNAAAAQDSEHQSKHAQKLLAELNSAGINNQEIQSFIEQMDAKVDGRYLTFSETRVPEGKLALRYRLKGAGAGSGSSKLELAYTPDNSHFEVVAHTDGVMLNYHFEFK